MNLEYNPTSGKFAEETARLCQQLGADAVMLIVFGSNSGSGCCCNIEPMQHERQQWLAGEMVKQLRNIAEALEGDLTGKSFPPDDSNQHKQTIE